MRIGLFDDWWRYGHAVDLFVGLTQAALDAGHELVVFAPARPPLPGGGAVPDWVEVDDLAGLSERDRDTADRMRANVRRVVASARDAGIDVFCDLDWRRHQQFAYRLVRAAPVCAWVVHRVDYLRSRPTWRADQRRRGPSRHAMRRISRGDNRFVVHTEVAEDRLRKIVDAEHVVRVGWPVPLLERRPGTRDDDTLQLLWVGGRRVEKGWGLLLDALGSVDGDQIGRPVRLSVVGADRGHSEQPTRAGPVSIRYDDRRLTTDELAVEYGGADLAMVLHDERFVRAGRASASLLSAVSAGCPALVSRVLIDQLDGTYRGMVPVDLTVESVATGIVEASRSLDELRRGAAEGPALIAEQHTYTGYLEALLGGSGKSAPPPPRS